MENDNDSNIKDTLLTIGFTIVAFIVIVILSKIM